MYVCMYIPQKILVKHIDVRVVFSHYHITAGRPRFSLKTKAKLAELEL